jgi:hypothetical protein
MSKNILFGIKIERKKINNLLINSKPEHTKKILKSYIDSSVILNNMDAFHEIISKMKNIYYPANKILNLDKTKIREKIHYETIDFYNFEEKKNIDLVKISHKKIENGEDEGNNIFKTEIVAKYNILRNEFIELLCRDKERKILSEIINNIDSSSSETNCEKLMSMIKEFYGYDYVIKNDVYGILGYISDDINKDEKIKMELKLKFSKQRIYEYLLQY